MNIIRMRQEERANKISDLRNSIKKALDKKKTITCRDILLSARANLNISDRTAKEYLEVALFQLGLKKEDLI